jgi:hypothetical protein
VKTTEISEFHPFFSLFGILAAVSFFFSFFDSPRIQVFKKKKKNQKKKKNIFRTPTSSLGRQEKKKKRQENFYRHWQSKCIQSQSSRIRLRQHRLPAQTAKRSLPAAKDSKFVTFFPIIPFYSQKGFPADPSPSQHASPPANRPPAPTVTPPSKPETSTFHPHLF